MLPDALRERGAEVDVLALYETVAEPLTRRASWPPSARADYVTFTSSSTVRFFFAGGRRTRSAEPRGWSASGR